MEDLAKELLEKILSLLTLLDAIPLLSTSRKIQNRVMEYNGFEDVTLDQSAFSKVIERRKSASVSLTRRFAWIAVPDLNRKEKLSDVSQLGICSTKLKSLQRFFEKLKHTSSIFGIDILHVGGGAPFEDATKFLSETSFPNLMSVKMSNGRISVAALPKKLKKLIIYQYQEKNGELPPLLEYLAIAVPSLNHVRFPSFPKHLKTLEIEVDTNASVLVEGVLYDLPTTLKFVKFKNVPISFFNKIQYDLLKLENLIELRLGVDSDLPPGFLDQLASLVFSDYIKFLRILGLHFFKQHNFKQFDKFKTLVRLDLAISCNPVSLVLHSLHTPILQDLRIFISRQLKEVLEILPRNSNIPKVAILSHSLGVENILALSKFNNLWSFRLPSNLDHIDLTRFTNLVHVDIREFSRLLDQTAPFRRILLPFSTRTLSLDMTQKTNIAMILQMIRETFQVNELLDCIAFQHIQYLEIFQYDFPADTSFEVVVHRKKNAIIALRKPAIRPLTKRIPPSFSSGFSADYNYMNTPWYDTFGLYE